MKESTKVQRALRVADIKGDAWPHAIIDAIKDAQARGYLLAKVEELNGNLPWDSEDFREELIEAAGYNIWSKDENTKTMNEPKKKGQPAKGKENNGWKQTKEGWKPPLVEGHDKSEQIGQVVSVDGEAGAVIAEIEKPGRPARTIETKPWKHDEAGVIPPIVRSHDKSEQIGQVVSDDEEAGTAKAEIVGVDIQRDGAVFSDPAKSYLSNVPSRFGMSELTPEQIAAFRITSETVAKVEAEIGRTTNAWGMIDPLELIRAVDRVLRKESHE